MVPMANNGAEIIYHKVIKPFVKKNEGEIDNMASTISKGAKDITSHGKDGSRDQSKL